MKTQDLGLVCSILGNVGRSHLLEDVKQKESRWS